MCKHKSGGMNKPSGTSESVSVRSPAQAALPSHNGPTNAQPPHQDSPFVTMANASYKNNSTVTASQHQDSPFVPMTSASYQDSSFGTSTVTASQQDSPFVTMATVRCQDRCFPTYPYQDGPFGAMAAGCHQDSPPSTTTKDSSFSAMATGPLSNKTCDMFRFNDNPPCDRELYQKTSYECPVLDSEDETEQSPMLLKDAYSEAATWNPGNILGAQIFDAPGAYAIDNRQDVLGSHEVFDPRGAYSMNNHQGTKSLDSTDNPQGVLGSEAFDPYNANGLHQDNTNCDNLSTYRNLRPYAPPPYPNHFEATIRNFDDRQRMDFGEHGYGAKHKKKWLLNHKCKSADSEPADTPFNRQLSARPGLAPYNYVQTHMDGCQSYVKPMYSNNSDPVPGPSGLQRPCSINWELGGSNMDSEFRSRSYSLTPTINFAVFESESSSEAEDVQEPMVPEPVEPPAEVKVKTMDDPFELPVMALGKVIPISPSAAQLSIASSYGDNGSPICKICHMTARENDPLISPCRCSGTMQYIHCGCLMRWLEVCHKRGRRPASCELCQYQYHWHKKFKIRHWTFPPCSRKDKLLHLLFILSVLLMVTCASLTVVFFKQDKGGPPRTDPHQELTQAEVGNLVCGVLFFVAFFVAIYVEAKSHDTLYKLLVKFIHINQQWYIDEYEKKETPPVAV